MMDKIYFIFVMIVVFYISVSSIQNFTINYEVLDELTAEFKQGYIEDIKVINNSDTCPENYTSMINKMDWPGSNKGCGCKDDTGAFIYNTGNCPMLKECKAVDASDSVPLRKWKGNMICLKRFNITYDKLKLVAYNNYSNCNNETHRTCGIIDGADNLLCLEKTVNCPITNIKFVKIGGNRILTDNSTTTGTTTANVTVNSTTTNTTLVNTTVITTNSTNVASNVNSTSNSTKVTIPSSNNPLETYLQINDNTYLYFNRTEISYDYSIVNNPSIIKVFYRVDITTPCVNPLRSPKSEKIFPLMKNQFDLMCDTQDGNELVDLNFSDLDQELLEDFYKDNGFSEKLHKMIDPFKIDISETPIKVWGKGYPGWSIKCQANQDSFASFYQLSNNLNKILITIIIHSFISIAILISIGVMACYIQNYFDLIIKAINLGFVIFNLILPTQIISNSNFVINLLTDEDGVLCGDYVMNLLLVEISSSTLSLQYSFIVILLIAILSIFIFVWGIFSWIKPATREVQEKLIEMKK